MCKICAGEPVRILQAETAEQLADARALFIEYADSLGFSLCFQEFDRELEQLPGDYAPPNGRLLLAFRDGQPIGCVALRRLDAEAGEMVRLYLRPQARGTGLGRQLSARLVAEARNAGYLRLRLHTVFERMPVAAALYRNQGFREIAPYTNIPVPGAVYMELGLAPSALAGVLP